MFLVDYIPIIITTIDENIRAGSHTDYGSLTKKKLMDCDGLEIQHPFTKVVTTYKFRTYLIRFNGIFGQWVYLNQQNIVLHIPN
ncbi:hypothetical protein RIR_jg19709.t1 [Rhizophagus irregularis DAOM 181602=DAOM 197198]|nr:hypothetical protein RIR_jg19709.t1 [Rhizophagus irregularis DAOM 181602=DAOM 197198]